MLGDHKAAVGLRFDQREPYLPVTLDQRPVGEISTGALRAAFDDVPGNHAGRHAVPVRGRPSEFEHHGRKRHCRVRHTPGDDHVCAKFQRLHESGRADVCIGRQHAAADVGQRLSRVHVEQRLARRKQRVEAGIEIVAQHHGHLHTIGNVEFLCQRLHCRAAARGIHAAGIGDDANAAIHAGGEDLAQLQQEVRGVSGFVPARALLLQNRHRHFRQEVHDEVVDGPAFHLAARGPGIVAPESGAVGDHHALFHLRSSRAITIR